MDETAWEALVDLARRATSQEDSWSRFWTEASPHIEKWATQPGFVGRLATDDDHRREIVVQSWEKLQERDCAKLRTFFAREETPDGGQGRRFRVWLRRVVKNIAIDYMRSLPEYVRKRTPAPEPATPSAIGRSVPSHDYWRSIVSITSDVAVWKDPGEGRAEAQRMLDFLDSEVTPRRRAAVALADAGRPSAEIARQLGVRNAAEVERIVLRARERLKFRGALELWSHGYADDEIATQLGLEDGAAADRMIKAAKELLRRAFKPS